MTLIIVIVVVVAIVALAAVFAVARSRQRSGSVLASKPTSGNGGSS